jgi:hypothetical protein
MTPKQESEVDTKLLEDKYPTLYWYQDYTTKKHVMTLMNYDDHLKIAGELQSKLEQQRKLLEEADKVVHWAKALLQDYADDKSVIFTRAGLAAALTAAVQSFDNLKKGQE